MKAEMDQFRDFVREHPRVLDELRKDPVSIQSEAFADEHRAVREYLNEHPGIKEELKKYPHFFDGLTAPLGRADRTRTATRNESVKAGPSGSASLP